MGWLVPSRISVDNPSLWMLMVFLVAEHVMTRCQLFFWLQLWNHFQRLFTDFFQAANGQVPLPSFMRCTWLLGSGLSSSAFVPCCCASRWPTWVERLLTILGILGVTAISWMFGSGPMLRLTLPACTSAVIACDWALDICMWEGFRRTSDVMVTPGSLSSLSSVIYIYNIYIYNIYIYI